MITVEAIKKAGKVPDAEQGQAPSLIAHCATCRAPVFWGRVFLSPRTLAVHCSSDECVADAMGIKLPA